ncbi:helix-turn-helix domain-containing protein, partial [Klebsiella pneumoniae]|uniref:helix-turn-helix domain-containing protein n=1 Tax=Klebsiella pneumoniae TaxID=573 RepID=UPI0030F2042E
PALGIASPQLILPPRALRLPRHRNAPEEPAATPRDALLDKLLAALAARLSRPFVLERFCEQEGGSERALRQQFRQQTGMTINHYLRQLRICHAQYLLQHTERLIGDIAMQCGFEDSNYFSVVFSREIGMSPGQWRQRSRAAA